MWKGVAVSAGDPDMESSVSVWKGVAVSLRQAEDPTWESSLCAERCFSINRKVVLADNASPSTVLLDVTDTVRPHISDYWENCAALQFVSENKTSLAWLGNVGLSLRPNKNQTRVLCECSGAQGQNILSTEVKMWFGATSGRRAFKILP